MCGLWRKADPRKSQLIRELPKYPLKVEKTEQACVIQPSEMLLFTVTHLSRLFCLIRFNLGPWSFHHSVSVVL